MTTWVLAGALVVLTSAPRAAGQGGPLPPPPPTYGPPPSSYGFRPDVRYFAGEGLGYDDGYLRLGLLAPAWQEVGAWATFADVRMLVAEDGDLGANFGGGYRAFFPLIGRSLGGYAYFDAGTSDLGNFQQVTLGVESLGTWIDTRLNTYLPVADETHAAAPITPLGSPFFSGNRILIDGLRTFEHALNGVDWRISGRLQPFGMELQPFAGVYSYFSSRTSNFTGWRSGVQAAPTDWSRVSCEVQSDRVNGDSFIVGLVLTYPIERSRRAAGQRGAAARLTDPVERTDWVVTLAQPERGTYQLGDPRNGVPWFAYHVSNNPADVTNPGAALGTFENPFTNFAQVRNASSGEELVYVRGGSGDGMSVPYTFVAPSDGSNGAIFTMRGGQWLFGAGINQTLPTIEFGNVILPALQANNPRLIPAASGNGTAAVDMRNRTVVSGVTVTGGVNGVIASARNNLAIRDNIFSGQSSRAIDLTNITESLVIERNQIGNFGPAPAPIGSDAVRLTLTSGTTNVSLLDNALNGFGAAEQGFQVDVSGTAVVSLLAEDNTSINGGNGFRLTTNNTAAFNGQFFGNNFNSVAGSGTARSPMYLRANDQSVVTLLIEDNTLVSGAGDSPTLWIEAIGVANAAQVTAIIQNNPAIINGAGASQGVTLDFAGATRGDITLRDNPNIVGGFSTGTGARHGLRAFSRNSSQLVLRAMDNTITAVGGNAANLFSVDLSALDSSTFSLRFEDNTVHRIDNDPGITNLPGVIRLTRGGTAVFQIDRAGTTPGSPVGASDAIWTLDNFNVLTPITISGAVIYQPGSTGTAP